MKPSARHSQSRLRPVAQLPKGGFEHPFHGPSHHLKQHHGKEHPRTIAELQMCTLSNHIREQTNWWEKAKDKDTVERWREEALQHDEGDLDESSRKLTPAMVNYVLEELRGYASLRDPETGVEVGPAERVWKSDKLISTSLREKLLAAVASLEMVPDSDKDWHPGSDGFVLNLVHPALYPIVYGRTMGKLPSSNTAVILAPPEIKGANPKFVSKRFQFLPSDFFVDDDGKVTLVSPYINNIHPTHHNELYSVIPVILQHALPMFERVLSDLLRPLLPLRIATSGDYVCGSRATVDCFRKYDGDLEVTNNRISLRDRTLQVIIRLANIVLTPERPEYPGGKWHVEGLRNEMIVSSFIYYYDSKNITESKLSFRRATSEPASTVFGQQPDANHMAALYDMDMESPCVQDVGDVITKTHRCVAFPNLYQHRVQSFHLEDPTKPGHRKILVFFLVDPTQRVFSATDVAPQQREWATEAMGNVAQDSAFARLPIELLRMISHENGETMTHLEAKEYRKELMSERVISMKENDRTYFEAAAFRHWPYYLCGD